MLLVKKISDHLWSFGMAPQLMYQKPGSALVVWRMRCCRKKSRIT